MLEGVIRISAYLFLLGVIMILLAAVPPVANRYPRIMLHGFLVVIGSFALVGLGAVLF